MLEKITKVEYILSIEILKFIWLETQAKSFSPLLKFVLHKSLYSMLLLTLIALSVRQEVFLERSVL